MSSLRSSLNYKNSKYFRVKLAKKNTRDKSKTGSSSNHESKKWQKYNSSEKNGVHKALMLATHYPWHKITSKSVVMLIL